MKSLTLAAVIHRLLDLEEALKGLLSLTLELTGTDVEKYTMYQNAVSILTKRIGEEK